MYNIIPRASEQTDFGRWSRFLTVRKTPLSNLDMTPSWRCFLCVSKWFRVRILARIFFKVLQISNCTQQQESDHIYIYIYVLHLSCGFSLLKWTLVSGSTLVGRISPYSDPAFPVLQKTWHVYSWPKFDLLGVIRREAYGSLATKLLEAAGAQGVCRCVKVVGIYPRLRLKVVSTCCCFSFSAIHKCDKPPGLTNQGY